MTRSTLLRAAGLLGVALTTILACQSQPQLGLNENPQRHQSAIEPRSGPGSGRGQGDGKGDRRGAAPIPQSKFSTFKPLSAGPLGADKILGYRHPFGSSKFRMGPPNVAPSVTNSGVYIRYTGAEGAYVEWPNGFASGVPNANAPATKVEPYANEPTAHTTLVLNYFKDRGIPQDQVAGTSISTQMQSISHTSDAKEIERKLVGYTTILHRKVNGYPVPESHAWARFNKNTESVYEQVWWPELPGDVLVAANAFQAMLSAPAAATAFKSKLPSALREKPGAIVIHHGTPVGEVWRVQVTYDVQDRFDTKSFDINGQPVRVVSWDTPPSGSRSP